MFSSRFIYSFLYLFLIILRSYTTIIPYSLQVCVLFRTSFSLWHHITVCAVFRSFYVQIPYTQNSFLFPPFIPDIKPLILLFFFSFCFFAGGLIARIFPASETTLTPASRTFISSSHSFVLPTTENWGLSFQIRKSSRRKCLIR